MAGCGGPNDTSAPSALTQANADQALREVGEARAQRLNVPMGNNAMGAGMRANPMGAMPMGANPMGAMPMGGNPMGAMPMGAMPMGANPMGAMPMGAMPMGGNPMGGNMMRAPLAAGMPGMLAGAQMVAPFQAMAQRQMQAGMGAGMAAPDPHGSPAASGFGRGPFPHGDLDLRPLATGYAAPQTRVYRPLEGRRYYFLSPDADATNIGVTEDPKRKPG